MQSCGWWVSSTSIQYKVVAGVHPVQSTYVLCSLSTDTSCRCFLGYVNTEHHFPFYLLVAFHAFWLPRNAPCPRDWCMTVPCCRSMLWSVLCVGVGGGIMATFCSTNHPLPIPVLSKLGLRSPGMVLIAASRRLVTSPFPHHYNKHKCTEKGTLLLRCHQN